MVSATIERDCIRFDFVDYCYDVDPARQPDDRLYLDSGNALGPGVIDHHHLPAYSGSATGLVVRHPDLIAAAVRADRATQDPFTFVLHQQPDLDCLASAYLATGVLCDGNLPAGAAALARYVDDVDSGHPGFSLERPFTLYTAFLLLVNDLFANEPNGNERTSWIELVNKGLQVVDFVMQRIASENVSILDVDAFECTQVFRPRDRREVELDRARYLNKLTDTASSCRQYKLGLPCVFGGTQQVDALFARDVQNTGDQKRCIYFKDWARSDRENAPSGKGFQALSVFIPESPAAPMSDPDDQTPQSRQVRRCILSVTPFSGATLEGLGEQLDLAESNCRIAKFGKDDRVIDLKTGEAIPARPGYANADPWYDGRGHNYTIVDSPRSGTRLEADQIEHIFAQFGNRAHDDAKPLWFPSPDDEAEFHPSVSSSILPVESNIRSDPRSPTRSGPSKPDNGLARMSSLVNQWQAKQNRSLDDIVTPGIFISYCRKNIEWVEEQVVEPLTHEFGEGQIFFDKRTLHAGIGWLVQLAQAVKNCRLFIPVYCPPYFQSEFCQWELQLAVTRDPTGRKQIMLPVMLEEIDLPAYCSLIQTFPAEREDFTEKLIAMAGAILES